MKRICEIAGLGAIILFSFYYTEKAAMIVQQKNPLMTSINMIVDDEKIAAVNAEISGNTIVPGLRGKDVNVEKSFLKMKDFGTFNAHYLEFTVKRPDVSIDDNKEKIITRGNARKKGVSFVIDNNEKVRQYFLAKGTSATVVSYVNDYRQDELEEINGEVEKLKFNNLESLLNKGKANVNICVMSGDNYDICVKNGKYLVKATHVLEKNNLAFIRNAVGSGAIILIGESASIDDVKLIFEQVKYKGLNVLKLSELISEKI